MKHNYYHPNPSLQTPWNYLQLGLLTFPISPFVGGLSIVAASLITWKKQYHIISDSPLHKAFGILSILLIITTLFAQKPLEAALGLWNFLPFFLFFMGLTPLIATPNQMRQISWIMVLGSWPILIMGFGQLFLNWHFKFQFLWIVIEWIIAKGGEPVGRMAANFMHANTLAAYLVTIFILGLGLCLESYQKPKIPVIIYLHISVICTFIALILTNSRNGWGIAIITCLAYSLYQGWRLIFSGLMTIITSILLAAYGPLPIAQILRKVVPYFIWARLNDQMYANRPVELMRKTQWEFAWNLTQQHPLTGTGLRSFSELYKQKMDISLGHPHNLFLMLSSETGLITTALFCGLLISILVMACKLLSRSKYIKPENRLIFFSYLLAFLAWILFNTVDITTFDIRLNTLSWVFIGALCGVSYRNLVIGDWS
ncbi:O-antigen ligase family protein [Anabaena sp. FACHB-1237]|uniref:O-antigen ligase family protein n=1 Tax=Anabaena sp. FACHB-1237 TaxID=2692769 RepID=UPI0016803F87|nr:O-antigen ligase family protein [Anabaena sp. FACHB-1237]MBD2139464.1 O-antigen ligase family protein [Anabaena sp. FACHB-1237]